MHHIGIEIGIEIGMAAFSKTFSLWPESESFFKWRFESLEKDWNWILRDWAIPSCPGIRIKLGLQSNGWNSSYPFQFFFQFQTANSSNQTPLKVLHVLCHWHSHLVYFPGMCFGLFWHYILWFSLPGWLLVTWWPGKFNIFLNESFVICPDFWKKESLVIARWSLSFILNEYFMSFVLTFGKEVLVLARWSLSFFVAVNLIVVAKVLSGNLLHS